MTKASNRLASLLHRFGVAGPARARAVGGSGAPTGIATVLLASLCALAGLLAFASAPAGAFTGHTFSGSFGSAGSGAGQLALVSNSGVAVNSSTHDVYVADTGNRRVDEFEADGMFVRAWGWGVADGLPKFETCTVALTGCQAGLEGKGPGEFTTPTFIAVDNSGGPSKGDVYVGDPGDRFVSKFTEAGILVEAWGVKGQLDGSTATGGPFTGIAGIAVDGSGNLFVYDPNANEVNNERHWFKFAQNGTPGTTVNVANETSSVGIGVDGEGNFYKAVGSGLVKKYTPSGELLGPVDAGQGEDSGFVVDSLVAGTEVFVAEDGRSVAHYGASCVPSGAGPCSPSEVFGGGDFVGGGVGLDPSSFAVFVADVANQRIVEFTTGNYADVTTEPASEVGALGATLHGKLDPAGNGNITKCEFEYVTDAAFKARVYGDPSVVTVPCAEGNSFSAPAEVEAKLSGLQPATTYHFRLVVSDGQGVSQGEDVEVTTPPAVEGVETEAPSNVLGHSATLNGKLNPNGLDTTYHFEYDTRPYAVGEAAHGTSIPIPDVDAGSTAGEQHEHVDLSGLQQGTTYHFRIVAHDSNGTTDGQDETLNTAPGPSIDSATATSVTRNSAVLNAQVNPEGAETHYHFEYDTVPYQSPEEAAHGTRVPACDVVALGAAKCETKDPSIPAGTSDVFVSTQLKELTEDTTYYWRVVASNVNGTLTLGVGHTFVYDTTGEEGLPDGRAYEMVTPAHKNGAAIGDVSFLGGIPGIASDGSRVIAPSIQCFGNVESCSPKRGNSIGSPYEFTRTPSGW